MGFQFLKVCIKFQINNGTAFFVTVQELVLSFRFAAVDEKCPELAMRPNFLTTFAMATDQSSKLGQGRNKTIICMYSSYQVSILNYKLIEVTVSFSAILIVVLFL